MTTKGSESWVPICLPRYNSSGFLHAFVGYITNAIGIIFVSGDREGFFELREWKAKLVKVSTPCLVCNVGVSLKSAKGNDGKWAP